MWSSLADTIHLLSWPTRASIAITAVAIYFTARETCDRRVDRSWRQAYAWTCLVCALSLTYYMLLLFGFVPPRSFGQLSRWLFPMLLLPSLWPAQFHRRETKELQRRVRA